MVRLVVQRVAQASVGVLGPTGLTPVSSIGHGLMVLVGIGADDGDADIEWAAKKLLALRLFNGPVSVSSPTTADAEATPCESGGDSSPVAVTLATEDATPGTFAAGQGKSWSRSVMETGGSVLLVSQFTLCHVLKGNKPDFHNAMRGDEAKVLYDRMCTLMASAYVPDRIAKGAFGEHMHVQLINDGPVTLSLDSKSK